MFGLKEIEGKEMNCFHIFALTVFSLLTFMKIVEWVLNSKCFSKKGEEESIISPSSISVCIRLIDAHGEQ